MIKMFRRKRIESHVCADFTLTFHYREFGTVTTPKYSGVDVICFVEVLSFQDVAGA
jgi:hypothetical protein